MLALVLMFACNNKDAADDSVAADDSPGVDSTTDDTGADDTDSPADDTSEPEEFSCGQVPELPAPSVPAVRMEGAVTWTLDFSEDAEANGLVDCTYSRTFSGLQRLDLPHTCPDCTVIAEGTATLTEGEDCYAQISSDPGTRTEMWGFSADGRFFRTSLDQGPMGELTTFTVPAEGAWGDLTWGSTSELSAGGTMDLLAVGQLQYATDPSTLLVDFSFSRTAPYAAGWEQNNPGDLSLDFTPQIGDIFPNGRFEDQCHDWVDLWDFYGSYLVIDSSQPDCGPCQSMAAGEPAFIEAMQAEGIPIRVITLMGAGLSASTSTPPASTVDAWIERFGIDEPMLYDRGFGYAVFAPFLEEYAGEDFGYPAWVIVDPEMRLIHGNIGFSNWDAVAEVIRADWAAR